MESSAIFAVVWFVAMGALIAFSYFSSARRSSGLSDVVESYSGVQMAWPAGRVPGGFASPPIWRGPGPLAPVPREFVLAVEDGGLGFWARTTQGPKRRALIPWDRVGSARYGRLREQFLVARGLRVSLLGATTELVLAPGPFGGGRARKADAAELVARINELGSAGRAKG